MCMCTRTTNSIYIHATCTCTCTLSAELLCPELVLFHTWSCRGLSFGLRLGWPGQPLRSEKEGSKNEERLHFSALNTVNVEVLVVHLTGWSCDRENKITTILAGTHNVQYNMHCVQFTFREELYCLLVSIILL